MNFWERYGECVGNNGNRDGINRNERRDCHENTSKSGQRDCRTDNQNADRMRGGCNEQDVRRKFDEYSGKGEDELMSELAQTVARMKSEGTFDSAAIENMYNTAAPFLNDMQRQRMRSIIDMLVK